MCRDYRERMRSTLANRERDCGYLLVSFICCIPTLEDIREVSCQKQPGRRRMV